MRSGSVGIFVVKVWREPTEVTVPPWRASVLNTVTKEQHYFASAEDLVAFLSALGLEQKTLCGLDDSKHVIVSAAERQNSLVEQSHLPASRSDR